LTAFTEKAGSVIDGSQSKKNVQLISIKPFLVYPPVVPGAPPQALPFTLKRNPFKFGNYGVKSRAAKEKELQSLDVKKSLRYKTPSR